MTRLLILMATVAWATANATPPTLYNKCSNIKINIPKGGAGVFFSDDCKTAYVLPPAKGQLTISGMSPTTNLQSCTAMNSLYAARNAQLERLKDLAQQLTPAPTPAPVSGGGSDLFPNPPPPTPNPGSNAGEADLLQQLTAIQSAVTQLDKDLANYAGIAGITAEALFIADQNKMVSAYQNANPQLHFEALPISQARLNFVHKASTSAGEQNGLLSVDVAGLSAMPDFSSADPNAQGVIFGGAMSGQIVLSLTGACPMYDEQTQKLKVDKVTDQNLGAYFSASVTYMYNLMANRSYTASYNIAQFFHRLQTSESSGGFFSSSTVNKLIVEKNSSDWFKFQSTSEDPRNQYDDSLEETVKAQLIDRVFKQVAMLSTGPADAAPALTTPKPDGAEVAAQNLQKCPYVYCQIGAAVLEVANAIFGSSSAVSEYIQNNNFWASDQASESKMLPFLGTIVFADGQ